MINRLVVTTASRVVLNSAAMPARYRHDRVVRGDGLARAAGDDQLLPDSQQVAVRQVIDSQDFLDGYAEIGGNDGQIFAVLHHVDAPGWSRRPGRVWALSGPWRIQGWRRQQRWLNRLGQQPEGAARAAMTRVTNTMSRKGRRFIDNPYSPR